MTADSVTAARDDFAFWPLGGSGPPVLLLHGFGADHLSWLANQQAVGTVATVSVLDLPGHGESSMDVGDGAVATLAERIAVFLDQKNLSKVHLVGHSLGAVTALFLAEMRPDLVASLVLISPAGLGGSIDRHFLTDFPRLTNPEQALELLQRLVVRPRLINRHLVARVLEQLGRPGARQALALIAEKLIASDSAITRATASDNIRALPRLTIWGRQDSINPLAEDRLAMFGGDTLIVPETGHMPHVEAPRLVNERICLFLASQKAL